MSNKLKAFVYISRASYGWSNSSRIYPFKIYASEFLDSKLIVKSISFKDTSKLESLK